jgi:hypothetical protein
MVVYELDDSVLVGVATLADLTGIVSRRSMDFDDAVINLPWRSFVQAFVVGLRLGLEQCTHLLVGTTHRGFAPKTKIPERGHEMVPTTDAVWLAAQGSIELALASASNGAVVASVAMPVGTNSS